MVLLQTRIYHAWSSNQNVFVRYMRVYGVDNYHHVNLYDQVNSFVFIVVLQYHLIKKLVNLSQPLYFPG